MQESLLSILRCPVTQTKLTMDVIKKSLKTFNGQEVVVIEEAILYAATDWFYPVIGGIPRLNVEAFLDYENFLSNTKTNYPQLKQNLLDKYSQLIKYVVKKNKRTKASFAKEWSVYNYVQDNTWDADDDGMLARFLKETDEPMHALEQQLVFDAGCGNGKLDLLLAPHCKTIIAMDFTLGFNEAFEKNLSPQVHFIQGDVQFPPVAVGYFDLVHCSGVLIHTNNAELSFSCIDPLVKEKGKLSVWLYHPRKNFIHNLFNATRKLTSRLPLTLQYYLYLLTIFPVSFCIKRLKGNKQNSREMMVSILDWFTPEFRSEHEHSEAATWFTKRGYEDCKITTTDDFGFNIIGKKRTLSNAK